MVDVGRRNLISLNDLSEGDLRAVVEQSVEFHLKGIDPHPCVQGTVVGSFFAKTSTRTRAAFGSAALRLGAQLLTYGPGELQLDTGESWEDTARTLGVMLDLLVARTAGPISELRRFSEIGGLPVVNAMAAEEHPTQALADLTAIQTTFGRLDGLKLSYVGEGNNTAIALALALSRFERNTVVLCCPPGYGIPKHNIDAMRKTADCTSQIVLAEDIRDLPRDSDVVYTTRWQTTGTSKSDPNWLETFRPFIVDDAVMRRCSSALFMHDLPAHRGQEVTTSVLEGHRSLAWVQVKTKLSSAAASIVHSMADQRAPGVKLNGAATPSELYGVRK